MAPPSRCTGVWRLTFRPVQDHQSGGYRVPYDHVSVGAEPTVHECVCRYRRERQFLPEAHKLANCLLLADAGYIDRAWFEQVNDAGGFYLVRGTQSLNPKIIQAWRGDGREVPKLAGLSLKEAGRRRCRAEVLDMVVKSGKVEYRLIRRWFAEEKRFCLWMTNLPRAAWSAEQVMSLYRCRWQVELLLKQGNCTTGSRVCDGEKPSPRIGGRVCCRWR